MSFSSAIDTILQNEGGYQNDPADSGNYNSLGIPIGTNYGISAPVLESYLGHPPAWYDSATLTLATAKQIYYNEFWLKYNLDQILDPLTAVHVFDMIINHGSGGAATIVQRALDSLGLSNYGGSGWGPMTRAEINRARSEGKSVDLNREFVSFRKAFYHSLVAGDPSKQIFLEGWLKRADKFAPGGLLGSSLGLGLLAIGATWWYYNAN